MNKNEFGRNMPLRRSSKTTEKAVIYSIDGFRQASGPYQPRPATAKPVAHDEQCDIMPFCPNYPVAFGFYETELKRCSHNVLMQLIDLFDNRAFNDDQRWSLLQLVIHDHFQSLTPHDQSLLLDMISETPALAMHLLLVELNNDVRPPSAHSVHRSAITDAPAQHMEPRGEPGINRISMRQGLGQVPGNPTSDDQQRLTAFNCSASLPRDIISTRQRLVRTADAHTLRAYDRLTGQRGFVGNVALALNQMMREEVSGINASVINELNRLLENAGFLSLTPQKQKLLISAIKSLKALEWPDAVDSLFQLAVSLHKANDSRMTVLQRYIMNLAVD